MHRSSGGFRLELKERSLNGCASTKWRQHPRGLGDGSENSSGHM